MCTVTLIARQNGYALGMNRDEQRSRIEALPPSSHTVGSRSAVYPSEPGGGTWIGVNDLGITFALINWYAIRESVANGAVTRGRVVASTLESASPELVGQRLRSLPLSRVNPFRLIGVFPGAHTVIEWRWNRRRMERIDHGWRTNAWFSSGFDEAGVQITRGKTFKKALRQKSSGSIEWLRRLHRSHQPARGAHSICMHRTDAATISYTEIVARKKRVTMTHCPECPCARSCADQPRKSELTLRVCE